MESEVQLPPPEPPRIRMTVTQDEDGNCTVIEHDLLRGIHRQAAKMPKDVRKVLTSDGVEGVMDVAQVRAIVFAQMFEELVNSGKVVLA